MKNKSQIIAAFLILVIIFLNFVNSYAATISELNQQKSDIEDEIDNNKKELEILESQMDEAERQVSQLNTSIAECQGRIDALSVQISENEVILKKAEEDYKKQNDLLADRIIAQYEEGEVQYLDLLLNSESLTDFISRYYIIGEIAEMDKALLNDIENTKNEIGKTRNQLEQDRASIETEKQDLVDKKAERETYISQLTEEQRKLQAQREAYDEELENIKNNIAEAEEALRRANPTNSTTYIGSGVMAWPVPGYQINFAEDDNLFGYRIHPIYGDWRLHTGVDIAAPSGAQFVAAESGTVIVADWYGGYGKTVVISHGGGISTLYGHGTSILVEEGEYVTRGTPVLTVGSTGNSTGPHAHFEVRVNGVPVDPLDYI